MSHIVFFFFKLICSDINNFAVYVSGVLGIPFMDVVRVLAAVLLLGNVQFTDSNKTNKNIQNMEKATAIISEVSVVGESELNSVANLLGVPAQALFRGITSRTHNTRSQLVKSFSDANMVSNRKL